MPLPLPQPHEELEEGTGSWLMMRMKDNEGNTAFHKGVESCNIDVVRTNKNGETPIYVAAKTSWNDDVVDEILKNCKSIDYGGPDGTTALHAAVV